MADETYKADKLSHPPIPDPPMGYGKIHRLNTAPMTSTGSNGDLAIILSTGTIYERYNDAWSLLTTGGGGSGTIQVIARTQADPNSPLIVPDDPTKGAIYTQDGNESVIAIWRWDVNDQNWVQCLG